ncbi:phosphoribosyltransferase [Scrofimicrobium sp. R131]|uniref:Phosphoribosyltransferase n=1 Tax=Scrofimicrobium appendicitidis TaxID=3079930 RepID=A0AAU7V6M2_9ACTO
MDKEILTWTEFGEASRELARQVRDSGWEPDLLISLARGGLIPGGALAYALDLKTIGSINVEFYTGEGTTLAEPLLLPPFMEVSADLGGRALIIDDVADSGKTLKLVVDLLSKQGVRDPAGELVRFEVRTAVLYRKSRTIIEPDYCWRSTDRWISFPWSTLPPV